MQLLLIRPSIQ